jgi:hypothetical protein
MAIQTSTVSSESKTLSPEGIFQTGLGFWASKTLLSAVELDVFSELAKQPATLEELRQRLSLHPRAARDFLDALVALGMLSRDDGVYSNSPEADFFLDKAKPSYSGGLLEMANARLYPFWGSLTEGLLTGKPQNEAKTGGDFFAAIYADQERLRGFAHAMTGVSMGPAIAIAESFPWQKYKTFIDIGTAEGNLPVQVALRHPHITGGGTDLTGLQVAFEEYLTAFGLRERLRFYANDFLAEPLPAADVLIMGHILHDWGINEKTMLLRKAYEALPDGGALIVYDAIIDDDRRHNVFGLLMSLNMLIETPAGFDYTAADCQAWMREAGFKETYSQDLVGGESMVVAIK